MSITRNQVEALKPNQTVSEDGISVTRWPDAEARRVRTQWAVHVTGKEQVVVGAAARVMHYVERNRKARRKPLKLAPGGYAVKRDRCAHADRLGTWGTWCSGVYGRAMAFVGPPNVYACSHCGDRLPFPAANDHPLNDIEQRAAQLAVDSRGATKREAFGSLDAGYEDALTVSAPLLDTDEWHAGWLARIISDHGKDST